MTVSNGLNSDSEKDVTKPLEGRTILVTRAKSQAKEFGEKLELAGATIVYLSDDRNHSARFMGEVRHCHQTSPHV